MDRRTEGRERGREGRGRKGRGMGREGKEGKEGGYYPVTYFERVDQLYPITKMAR